MSTLSAISTLAEVKASYADNASYIEDNSPAKARAFITACKLLVNFLPKQVSKEGGETELDVRIFYDQINDAERFLSQVNISASYPKTCSFEYFRD
ncbi:MAG TPA: hypothetical protein VIH42_03160 [Thermoguttaceae bacterium]